MIRDRSLRSTPGVYAIVNLQTGDAYIGSGVSIGDRLARHDRDLTTCRHRNQRLQRAWIKYGADSFRSTVVAIIDTGERDRVERERQAIAEWDADTYNIAEPGESPRLPPGYRHSPEVRRRISEGRSGIPMADSTKELLRVAATGRRSSPEAVAAMRRGLTGQRRSPEAIENYRRSWTPERRARHSAAVRRSAAAKRAS